MNIVMEEADIIKKLESLLDVVCADMQRDGTLKRACPEVRDWWGKRKAQMRAKADLPQDKWRD